MEFHYHHSADYPENTLHSFQRVEQAIEDGEKEIHTTQLILTETRLFDKGYRIFFHTCKFYSFEITLGECKHTKMYLRMGMSLPKLIMGGEFE